MAQKQDHMENFKQNFQEVEKHYAITYSLLTEFDPWNSGSEASYHFALDNAYPSFDRYEEYHPNVYEFLFANPSNPCSQPWKHNESTNETIELCSKQFNYAATIVYN